MRGATAVISMVLMFLVVIGATGMFFSYFSGLQADVVSAGEKQMVELDIPPKLLNLICYTGYGYMELSLSQGQKTAVGQVLYSVDLDTGKRLADGFADINITETGKVYIPYFFEASERYFVTLSGNKWKITESCRPFDDPHLVIDMKFEDGSGTTASDTSEYENDGTTNNITWATGYSGEGLLLNGLDSYVSIPSSESTDIYTSFSVGIWFKYNGRGPENKVYHTLVQKNPTGNGANDTFHIWVANDTRYLEARVGDGSAGYTLTSNESVNDSSFHYAFLSYNHDSNNYSLYLDGSLKDYYYVGTSWIPVQHNAITTLGYWFNYKDYFNGTIDDFRMYTRAFTDEEVSTLYNAYEGSK